MNPKIIDWLISGDVSIQYQVHRDLLGVERKKLQNRIELEGWGLQFLSFRKQNGHWGRSFYQPKWISTHYTLLDLRNLCIRPTHEMIRESVTKVFEEEKGQDGGINPAASICESDVCINGMAMNYGCYFGVAQAKLISVVDYLLAQRMADGGFNCRSTRSGARHSSLHTTLSVAEGILEYRRSGYAYRLKELEEAEYTCQEFMLQHRLYKSDKTGQVINDRFTRLPYPSRWFYDILRALNYFSESGTGYDKRMDDALEILMKKQRSDGTWPLQAKYPGATHFDMEKPGKPSRWNTLRALRVLKEILGKSGIFLNFIPNPNPKSQIPNPQSQIPNLKS